MIPNGIAFIVSHGYSKRLILSSFTTSILASKWVSPAVRYYVCILSSSPNSISTSLLSTLLVEIHAITSSKKQSVLILETMKYYSLSFRIASSVAVFTLASSPLDKASMSTTFRIVCYLYISLCHS